MRTIQNEKAFKEAQKYVAEGITGVTEKTRKKIKKIIIESWLNNSEKRVNWRFTTQDARIKLKRLYPSYQD